MSHHSSDAMAMSDLFFALYPDADDLASRKFDWLEDSSLSSVFEDNEPAPAFAPWAVSDFAAPAPATNVVSFSFSIAAPAPGATNWSCPRCNLPLFAARCQCGLSSSGANSAPTTTPPRILAKPTTATPTPTVASRKPAQTVWAVGDRGSNTKNFSKPSRGKTTAGRVTITAPSATASSSAPVATTAAKRVPAASSSSGGGRGSSKARLMEAAEARESALRQQVWEAEQRHAVGREYATQLRRALSAARVRVASTVNPFTVMGMRPKRLFRSKGEAQRMRNLHRLRAGIVGPSDEQEHDEDEDERGADNDDVETKKLPTRPAAAVPRKCRVAVEQSEEDKNSNNTKHEEEEEGEEEEEECSDSNTSTNSGSNANTSDTEDDAAIIGGGAGGGAGGGRGLFAMPDEHGTFLLDELLLDCGSFELEGNNSKSTTSTARCDDDDVVGPARKMARKHELSDADITLGHAYPMFDLASAEAWGN